MADDLERRLRDVPAAFPRPGDAAGETARRHVLGTPRRRGPHVRRLSLLTACAVGAAATIGFTAGHWLIPAQGEAATSVSLAAMPSTLTFGDAFTLYGSLASGRADEAVTIEARDCGAGGTYHVVGGATTVAGGAFAAELGHFPERTTQYRARWRDGTSTATTVFVRPRIEVRYRAGVLRITAWAAATVRGQRAILQMYDAHGSPQTVRTFVFAQSDIGSGGQMAERVRLPHGRVIRVILPSIGPCFADGVSAPVST